MLSIIALFIVFATGYFIIKKYNTQAILLFSGLLMICIGIIGESSQFLPKGTLSSGAAVIDLFLVIKALSAKSVAEIGLIIMATGGFAKYMGHIGAANALVKVAIKPLSYIRNPYILLGLTYIVGQVLNVFIPSAVGLAMLLLIALYPVLVSIGCTPASVAAVLATSACLDLGPASGASNKAAEIIGIDAASYFIDHQLMVGIITAIVIAILHMVTQKFFDRRDQLNGVEYKLDINKEEQRAIPIYFAILPILPLALLLTFSKFLVTSIKIDVVTAMFLSLAVAMLFDFIYSRDGKKVAASLKVYLQGMGDVFASVVSLIIAAQVFVVGLETIGFIDGLMHLSEHFGLNSSMMIVLLVSIIGIVTLLSGSGNAAFFSLGSLAPTAATNLGISTATLAMPMQLSAGIFRSFSPVSGVVLACAGVANISPIELVKRTTIPMVGGLLATIISSIILG
ncbi:MULTISPECIES: C4-dicarboxylate transporter DcuC [Actinobacillus]|uniref:Anaerobic c4-dicarboxylate antiporter n=1 Tax=Actinobacillus lignieresii TaxID=720 RepID=A0A380TTL1_ACTLI|nr:MULTISPECIES: C4-dicarboxylate transporter DcuC [Actinobacillus]WGE34903.1 C4-dicarboxylate transporter DcuC [Actinobacillus genomosp. 1]SUT90890.1 anaerobic c4-dicarboxylate antiporter [Actinobacillus lignieresii]VEB25691.1 anaerobic c4-dicarboxylate antiporter [Actinobacillus lignieresii]